MNELKKHIVKAILIAFVLLNPLAVLLLSKSYIWTIIIFVITAYLVYAYYTINKNWIKVVLFNIALIVSISVYAETIFRYFYPERNIPVIYESRGKYYFNLPNLNKTFITSEYATIFRTDEKGYRISPIDMRNERAKNGTILFIGDSFTQGAQVQYSDMFSSLVQDEFQQQIVVNAGISGAGIVDEYYYYIEEGKSFNCKYIVLEIGVFNDFFDIRERTQSRFDKILNSSHLYTYFHYHSQESSKSNKLKRWAEPFFEYEQDNIDNNILYKISSENKERDKRNFRTTLKAFNDAVISNGGKLVVVLIPSKEQVSQHCLDEVTKAYGINPANLDMTYPNRWLRQQTNEIGIDFIDLLEDFKSSTEFPFYYIDEHLNECGHQIVSKALINYFNNEL